MKKYYLMIAIFTLVCNKSVLAKETTLYNEQTEVNKLLHNAILINSVDELAGIVNNGADINNEYHSKWTPLMFAAFACAEEKTIKEIIRLGGDRKLKDSEDKTAYMIAIEADECPENFDLLNPDQN